MKILVIGCGSIGKRHINNILSLNQNIDVIAWNRSEKRLKEVSKNYGIYSSLNLKSLIFSLKVFLSFLLFSLNF